MFLLSNTITVTESELICFANFKTDIVPRVNTGKKVTYEGIP